ncbi:RNA polymerase sigma factor [Candidatus Frankia nodulisporulans]|uniref:RNA polymerase sigma factor n=1 Tax=Candidatus Frankia nodulisporulans TaxID=2060052 RepID=UPI0013D67B76|nr:sigma-70 family RNA polymerase sigma factor [Candidatus Frankia nodulisporulans]
MTQPVRDRRVDGVRTPPRLRIVGPTTGPTPRDGTIPGLEPAPDVEPAADASYPGWEDIYRDNVDRIYRLMFAKVGNRADAEDLTAEVFTTALRPLRVSASVGEVRAYLNAVARTALAAHWRRTLGVAVTVLDTEHLDALAAEATHGAPRPADRSDTTASPAVTPPAGPDFVGGSVAAAEQILAALSPRYQQILRLRFLESRTIREAAAELGVSVANAKVLQHRALRKAAQLTPGGRP